VFARVAATVKQEHPDQFNDDEERNRRERCQRT
jgi:hypothetical protein